MHSRRAILTRQQNTPDAAMMLERRCRTQNGESCVLSACPIIDYACRSQRSKATTVVAVSVYNARCRLKEFQDVVCMYVNMQRRYIAG